MAVAPHTSSEIVVFALQYVAQYPELTLQFKIAITFLC